MSRPDTETRSMTIVKQLVAVVLIALVGGGLMVGWAGSQGDPEAGGPAGSSAPGRNGGPRGGAAPVILAPVETAATSTRLRAVGTAEAVQQVVLYPEDSGLVTEVFFEAGDRVEEGEVLVRLDRESERLAVELARSRLEDAQRRAARLERLRPSGVATEVELDEARLGVTAARNALQAAELALAQRDVRAPFAGIVGLRQVSVGDTVSTSTRIATLDDRSELLVTFELPERYAGLIATGHPVEASTPAFPQDRFAGRIQAVDSRVDPSSRTLRVRASLPNADDRLRPGMSFAVLVAFEGRERPSVPETAVQWDNKGSFVWTVADDKARRVPVLVLERRDGRAILDAELVPSQMVVIEGVQRLRDGGAVSPVGDPAGDPAGGPVIGAGPAAAS